MYSLYDLVVLNVDLPSHKLYKGDTGTIVFISDDESLLEVEFEREANWNAVITLSVLQVLPVDLIDASLKTY